MSNINSKLVFTAALLLFVLGARNCKAENIDWEFRYPLRLFAEFRLKDARYFVDYDSIKWDWGWRKKIYVAEECRNAEFPITCSERAIGPTRKTYIKSLIKERYLDASENFLITRDNNQRLADVVTTSAIRYHIDSRFHYSTYVLSDEQKAKEDRKAPVWIFLKDPSHSNNSCSWTVDGVNYESPCSKRVAFRIRRGKKTSKISVKVLGIRGASYSLSGEATRIKDMLIVGLGDSFASGEGNPDIAATLSDKRTNDIPIRPARHVKSGRPYAAYWLDRNCHRSLLGSQARAAIHLAAENPKVEIIFLGLACSGSTISEGILGPYKGVFESTKYSRKYPEWIAELSQVNQAIYSLCEEGLIFSDGNIKPRHSRKYRLATTKYKQALDSWFTFGAISGSPPIVDCAKGFKRKIDAVLLSVGGNDVGFAGVIFDSIKENYWGRQMLLWNGELTSPSESNTLVKNELMKGYRLLDRIFETKFGISDPKRVIVTTYPSPLNNENGELCGSKHGPVSAGLEWMPPFKYSKVSLRESREILEKVVTPLNRVIARAPDRNGRRWTVANSHVTRFEKHGWCANVADQQNFVESSTRPPQFNAYAHTTRWFRTINDGVLTQNQLVVRAEFEKMSSAEKIILPKYLKTFGMFHPNGLGAAAMADALLVELRKLVP